MNSHYAFVLGYPVYGQDLTGLKLSNRLVISTLNGHSYSVAKRDKEFRQALLESDVLLPDGISIVLGARILNERRIQKIAGYDVFIYLMDFLNETDGSCFFLGSSSKTLEIIGERIAWEYPRVKFGCFSPPYKEAFTEEDNLSMCRKVNEFMPDVLFVGMTAPKQEKWVHENKSRLYAGTICSIGAVFDFYAGTTQRPPAWMIRLRLEWLGRLLREPRRMWKRYLLSTPVFFIDVMLHRIGLMKGVLYQKQTF